MGVEPVTFASSHRLDIFHMSATNSDGERRKEIFTESLKRDIRTTYLCLHMLVKLDNLHVYHLCLLNVCVVTKITSGVEINFSRRLPIWQPSFHIYAPEMKRGRQVSVLLHSSKTLNKIAEKKRTYGALCTNHLITN